MTTRSRMDFPWKQFVAAPKPCTPNISRSWKPCPFHPNQRRRNDQRKIAERGCGAGTVLRACSCTAQPNRTANSFKNRSLAHSGKCLLALWSGREHHDASRRAGGGVGG